MRRPLDATLPPGLEATTARTAITAPRVLVTGEREAVVAYASARGPVREVWGVRGGVPQRLDAARLDSPTSRAVDSMLCGTPPPGLTPIGGDEPPSAAWWGTALGVDIPSGLEPCAAHAAATPAPWARRAQPVAAPHMRPDTWSAREQDDGSVLLCYAAPADLSPDSRSWWAARRAAQVVVCATPAEAAAHRAELAATGVPTVAAARRPAPPGWVPADPDEAADAIFAAPPWMAREHQRRAAKDGAAAADTWLRDAARAVLEEFNQVERGEAWDVVTEHWHNSGGVPVRGTVHVMEAVLGAARTAEAMREQLGVPPQAAPPPAAPAPGPGPAP